MSQPKLKQFAAGPGSNQSERAALRPARHARRRVPRTLPRASRAGGGGAHSAVAPSFTRAP